MMKFDNQTRSYLHVILRFAQNLRAGPHRVPSTQILRFAQDDM